MVHIRSYSKPVERLLHSQGIWRDSGDGFAKLTIQDDDVTKLLQANQGIMQDSKGNIWFGVSETQSIIQTTNDIWRYDGVNFKNFTVKDGLNGYSVWSMCEDSNGYISSYQTDLPTSKLVGVLKSNNYGSMT